MAPSSSFTAEDLPWLLELAKCPRQVALLRIESTEHKGEGLATRLVPLLQELVESWTLRLEQQHVIASQNLARTTVSEEKKETSSTPCRPTLQDDPLTNHLHQMLQLHAAIARIDPTLAEEMGRQGSHVCLAKILNFSSDTSELTESDRDVVMELQDMVCEVAVRTGGSFPLTVSPFSADVIQRRLPLVFDLDNNNNGAICNEREGFSNTNDNRLGQSVLIHQVTSRQSAQEDVGFVMWPSAVALSRWILLNSSVIRGKHVLELGAGCGLSGIVAARRLSAGQPTGSHVTLTDVNSTVLENLQRNVLLNAIEACTSVVGLDFYQQTGDRSDGWIDTDNNMHAPVDVILAADIICQPSDAVAAARTIHDVLKCGCWAVVICASGQHRFGVDVFADECQRVGLDVTESNVAAVNDGSLLQHRDMGLTTGYVDGMTLNMFDIGKPSMEHSSR